MRFKRIPTALAMVLLASVAAGADKPTHQQIGTIDVGGAGINTFCMDAAGRLLVAAKSTGGPGNAEIRVYAADGELEATWKVPFETTAINVSPKGDVFVAGAGQIARLNEKGEVVKQGTTPQIQDMDTFREQVRLQVQETMKSRASAFETQIKTAETLVAKLNQKPEAERSAIDKLRLRNAERQLELVKTNLEQNANPDPASINVDAYLNAKMRVPGLAVSDEDIFVAVSSLKGYGYDVWRVDHDFYNPKQLVQGLRGCCGQMDIQCCKGDLYVAENSRHRVARYDRDGKELASWGKADRNGKDGFEGCCNPMNLRFGKDGEVLTAESGCGAIKRYSPEGEFLGVVGNAELTGGCKHVAIAAAPDASRIFMLDITRSRIAVLAPQETKSP